jgi:GMP synthase (glutamine-hydrolysing)
MKKILIFDNGSQYTHLIKRNCRDLDFDAEIINAKADESALEKINEYDKIIISGGPSSVYLDKPTLCNRLVELIKEGKIKKPLLGICYGQQLIAHVFGAKVANGKSAEYGMSKIKIIKKDALLFKEVPTQITAWVSHFDEVKEIPRGFVVTAKSDTCEIEGLENKEMKIYSVQFHPEVWHTEFGEKIIKNFLES